MFLSTPSCILTMTQCSQSRLRWMYALHAEGVGVHLYVTLATVSSGPAAGSVFPQFPDWLTWDNLSELSEMAWSDFFLHISPALRNEIRRSQIDGWLTGVDRHIALTSVKNLTRANRWLSPAVQLFPFADTDCCGCKKSRSVKNIHLCRGGDGGFLLVLDERNREQAPTLFALPKQVWYPRVKQHLHGLLERSAHSSYVFPRNAHRFCTTQSEKDKTTQISKIQIYMVPCTCRRRGRAPFSLNFLSTDQAHASGRASLPGRRTQSLREDTVDGWVRIRKPNRVRDSISRAFSRD